jgi:hypothetical protein
MSEPTPSCRVCGVPLAQNFAKANDPKSGEKYQTFQWCSEDNTACVAHGPVALRFKG